VGEVVCEECGSGVVGDGFGEVVECDGGGAGVGGAGSVVWVDVSAVDGGCGIGGVVGGGCVFGGASGEVEFGVGGLVVGEFCVVPVGAVVDGVEAARGVHAGCPIGVTRLGTPGSCGGLRSSVMGDEADTNRLSG